MDGMKEIIQEAESLPVEERAIVIDSLIRSLNPPSAKNELRPEYERSDFTGPLVRGKYANRLRESSNIVVLKPEVAAVFPTGEAVNTVLNSLIKLIQTTTRLTKRSSGRGTKRRAV